MGQSLATAAVRGTSAAVRGTTLANEKCMLLEAGDIEGLIALNHSQFGSATMKAGDDADDVDDDADDNDDDGDDSDDDDDDDDDDDADDDDKSKGKKQKVDPKDEHIQRLSAEARKRRKALREREARIADLEAENARLKGKSKSKKDDEDDDEESETDESKTLKQENEALKNRLRTQALRTEFTDLVSGEGAKIKFKDPKVAFRLLDLDDVEIDEDGDIDGLEDAIKDLAKSAPYLLAEDKGKKDKDDEDDEDKPRRTGQRTGGSRSRRKGLSEAALRKKYGIVR